MTNKFIFHPPATLDDSADITAMHMPQGRAWDNKNIEGSNIRGLVKSISAEFLTVQQKIYELAEEFDIQLTSDLLPDWEKSVGLPDSCYKNLSDLQMRRDAVIRKLRKIPIVEEADFEDLAFEIAGVTVTVTPGRDLETVFPFTFPTFFSDGYSRFRIYVQFAGLDGGFPYTFPITFASSAPFDIVKCVFSKVKPSNVVIVYFA